MESFGRLRELNLSSNAIEKIEGLQSLVELEVLNLSCNRIQVVQGLASCHRLRRLVLSHNRIAQISGLQQLAGETYALEHVDLRNNKIASLRDLQCFQALTGLRELLLHTGKGQSNPCCAEPRAYLQFVAKLHNFQAIERLDGRTPAEVLAELGGAQTAQRGGSGDYAQRQHQTSHQQHQPSH